MMESLINNDGIVPIASIDINGLLILRVRPKRNLVRLPVYLRNISAILPLGNINRIISLPGFNRQRLVEFLFARRNPGAVFNANIVIIESVTQVNLGRRRR